MVKAPSHYSPTADVEAAVGRANVVLDQMRKYGALGANEAAAVDVSAIPGTAGELGRDEQVTVAVENGIAQAKAFLVPQRSREGTPGRAVERC